MSSPGLYATILVMAAVTYLIRMLPLTLLRRRITNRFFRSFLFYVPYATLAAMTFPAIIFVTDSVWPGMAGLILAFFLAYRGNSLFTVALAACVAVLIVERLLACAC